MEIEGTDEQNKDFHAKTWEWFEKLEEFIEEQEIALEALKSTIK